MAENHIGGTSREPSLRSVVSTSEKTREDVLHLRLKNLGLADAHRLVEAERFYGNSWRKRGGVGAYMMLARKWDRIEQAVEKCGWDIFAAYDEDSRDEGIMDDIRDLRRYLMLVEEFLTRGLCEEGMATPDSLKDGEPKRLSDSPGTRKPIA